jgi:hypothetical protein
MTTPIGCGNTWNPLASYLPEGEPPVCGGPPPKIVAAGPHAEEDKCIDDRAGEQLVCEDSPTRRAPPPLAAPPYPPIDHPIHGTPLHRFRSTGEVSWECMSDCTGAVALPLVADGVGAGLASVAVKEGSSTPAGALTLAASAAITAALCYGACSDLEGLPPPPEKPEPIDCKDPPDASVSPDASK